MYNISQILNINNLQQFNFSEKSLEAKFCYYFEATLNKLFDFCANNFNGNFYHFLVGFLVYSIIS